MLMPHAPYSFEVRSSVRYGTVPAVASWDAGLFLDLLLPQPAPSEPVPAVVYIHGGGWRNGDKSAGMYPWYSPMMAAHGFVAVNLGYRLTGRAPFPAQIHDAKAAIRWLRASAAEYGIDPNRIGVWGDSAGGHLASLLGTTAHVPALEGDCGCPGQASDVQAVVARCAPSDFTAYDTLFPAADVAEFLEPLFGGPLAERAKLAQLASPVTHVTPDAAPFLIVHGSEDETAALGHADRMVTALRAVGVDVTFHVVHGGHHNMLADLDLPWGNHPWTELGEQALGFFADNHGYAMRGTSICRPTSWPWTASPTTRSEGWSLSSPTSKPYCAAWLRRPHWSTRRPRLPTQQHTYRSPRSTTGR